ncbi:hypothetical protein K435DRAFT_809594 [Dendrothele bispora CBS 962.96]|uniref:Uncharacterized protein n=1 Tax=Dendrothele bispora (strain CBS 962.96) TaxID=1314807 RepID=A0A4S8KYW7_DENBC|nr:hypothetical protein K435DRAFT_809594 [Dendrothele bispora CBS 962.96]
MREEFTADQATGRAPSVITIPESSLVVNDAPYPTPVHPASTRDSPVRNAAAPSISMPIPTIEENRSRDDSFDEASSRDEDANKAFDQSMMWETPEALLQPPVTRIAGLADIVEAGISGDDAPGISWVVEEGILDNWGLVTDKRTGGTTDKSLGTGDKGVLDLLDVLVTEGGRLGINPLSVGVGSSNGVGGGVGAHSSAVKKIIRNVNSKVFASRDTVLGTTSELYNSLVNCCLMVCAWRLVFDLLQHSSMNSNRR